LNRVRLCLKLLFLPPLLVDALLKLFQLGLEQTDLGRRIVICKRRARR
jgi:hypothetical protein